MGGPFAALEQSLEALRAEWDAAVAPTLAATAGPAVSDAELVALARASEDLGRRLDALRTMVAGEIAERSRPSLGGERLSARYGCRDASELLQRVTGVSAATARSRAATAHDVRQGESLTGEPLPAAFPDARDAFLTGALGIDALTAITRTLAPLRERCAVANVAAAERELVAAATGTTSDAAPPATADDIRIQAKVWALYLDPDGALPDDERNHRLRGVRFGRSRDGLVDLQGRLLPEVAAQLQRLWDAYLSPRAGDGHADAAASGPAFTPDDGTATGEPPADLRSRPQRQHDALAGILAVAARSTETPTLGGQAPTLLVTVAAQELHRPAGIAYLEGVRLPDETGSDTSRTPVPASFARQIACCGGIQTLTLGGAGQVLSLSSPQRVFTAHQRRAIIARDGGCVIPGCLVPAAWCEIHHVVPHAAGGATHIDNGVMLCWHHHRTIDTGGWRIRVSGGVPEIRGPSWWDPSGRWRPSRRAVAPRPIGVGPPA
ncbi:DUF222 domain-containing protein [Microbacterium limosum]|uniref:DUF222 domain-containing protein n=1 Tax=Microbacterium limosum TaxID=3079935 RepID=A0AAU0MFJ4_9MICO|nr:DUF222 domain-containing protein [Microbacterium sp. Y20]WOQ69233.1 DUF222 domain-containing protein [Microbacterium sp. Y20]